MKRRSFLLGAGSAAAGGSALIGTGAFSRIDAQRSVTVQVAEDPNAYLGMNDCIGDDGNPTPNSSFADLDDLGHLRVDMGESGNGGSGVNSESISWFDNVFQLCNQGKEDVCLWISEKEGADPDRVTFYVNEEPEATTPEKLAFEDGDLVGDDPDLQTFTGAEDSILLEVGHCVCVGIQVYTREDEDFEIAAPAEGDELLNEVSLVADVSEDACKGAETVCGAQGSFNCVSLVADGSAVGSHGFDIENVGDAGIDQELQYVILDSPDQDSAVNLDPLPPGGVDFESGESAFPVAGILAYIPSEECDTVVGQPRDEWDGMDAGQLLTLPTDSDGTVRYDLIEGLTESRFDTIQGISGYADLESAFDDGTSDPDPNVPADAYLTQIDYSAYDLSQITTDDIAEDDTDEFEQRVVDSDIPTCDDGGG